MSQKNNRMPNHNTAIPLALVLVLGLLACGDDAARGIGDAMADAARVLRDSSADVIEDVGDELQDTGRVEAQSCQTCGRRYEVLADTSEAAPLTPAFSTAGFGAIHIAAKAESLTACEMVVFAYFGAQRVRIHNGGLSFRSVTLAPVTDRYEVRSECGVVVQGEVLLAR